LGLGPIVADVADAGQWKNRFMHHVGYTTGGDEHDKQDSACPTNRSTGSPTQNSTD
jgi:hypothetical protein